MPTAPVFFVVVRDLNAGCHPGMVSTLSAYYRANAMCPPDGVGFVCHAFEKKKLVNGIYLAKQTSEDCGDGSVVKSTG